MLMSTGTRTNDMSTTGRYIPLYTVTTGNKFTMVDVTGLYQLHLYFGAAIFSRLISEP